MLSLWAIGLLGLLNQVEALWSPAQQSSQFSPSGWGTSPAAQNPWSFNRPMTNNMPNMNAGGMPTGGGMPGSGMPGSGMPGGGMPGSGMPSSGMPGSGMPGSGMSGSGMPGSGMPGSGMSGGMAAGGMRTGGMPGGGPGYMSGAMSGAMPGAMPGMSSNMMGNMRNGYPPSYMSSPRNTICVAPVSQPRLCMVNGENTHKYRLKDVIEFLGHPNIEKVPKCVQGVPRVNCADYYAAQYIWKRGYCYCKNFHNNLPTYQMGSRQIRCVLNNCGACSQEFYVDKQRVVRFGAQWGTGQSFQYTSPTQQTPTSAQFGQMNKQFFPRPNQTPSWGQSPNPSQNNAWNFNRPMPNNNMPSNVPGNMPGSMPNMAGNMAGNMPGNMAGNMPNSMLNNMRNLMGNMRPSVTPNMPRSHGLGYPSALCYAPPHLPNLCTENGENQHKFTLKEVMRMLGDKNIEKITQCVPGIPRVNCANYNSAQYIWKRGYCYCKRYHSNIHAFKKYDPLRCVLNDCGACSQEFYIGKSRIVDCD